jgi:hypothetical protein
LRLSVFAPLYFLWKVSFQQLLCCLAIHTVRVCALNISQIIKCFSAVALREISHRKMDVCWQMIGETLDYIQQGFLRIGIPARREISPAQRIQRRRIIGREVYGFLRGGQTNFIQMHTILRTKDSQQTPIG